MFKYTVIFLFGATLFSCNNAKPEIPGAYKNYDTGELIEIDCDYKITLPTDCCNSLPSGHGDIVELSATGTNKSEVTLSVMVDNVQWSFGTWDKHRSTIEIDGEVYRRNEVRICNK